MGLSPENSPFAGRGGEEKRKSESIKKKVRKSDLFPFLLHFGNFRLIFWLRKVVIGCDPGI